MDILEELQKEKKRAYDEVENNTISQEANQLLLNAHSEDAEILRVIEMDHQLKYDANLKEDYNRTKHAEEIYKQESFTGNQIKALCIKYNLRMLPTSYYNGSIPTDLGRRVAKFAEENNIKADNYNLGRHLFILAPKEQFNMIQHVPRQVDPILFFRMDGDERATESDTFVQIMNWGSDFSFMRMFSFLMSKHKDNSDSMPNYQRTWFMIGFVILGLFMAHVNFFLGLLFLAAAIPMWWVSWNSYKNDEMRRYWNKNKDSW